MLIASRADAQPINFTYSCGGPVKFNPGFIIFIKWGWPNDPSNHEVKFRTAKRLGQSRLFNVLTEYYEAPWPSCNPKTYFPNNAFSDVVYNYPTAPPAPPAAATFAQEEAVVDAVADALGTGNGAIYVVLYPPGAKTAYELSPTLRACQYHRSTSALRAYAAFSYYGPPGGCGCVDGASCMGTISSSLVHELAEVVTDPYGILPALQAWRRYDATDGQPEIGDICNEVLGWPARNFQIGPTGSWAMNFRAKPLWSASKNTCLYQRSTHGDVFTSGLGGTLKRTRIPGVWHDWGKPSGVTLATAPGAASHMPGYLDAFVVDTAGRVRHAYSNNDGATYGWDDWGAPPGGGQFVGRPAVASWGYQRLDIWVRATGAAYPLYRRAWDAFTDTGWVGESVPFGITGSPAITANAPGHLYLAVRDSNLKLRVAQVVYAQGPIGAQPPSYWSKTPTEWLWGPSTIVLQSDPAIVSHSLNTWDVFEVTASSWLTHFYYNPSVTPSFGSNVISGPGVVLYDVGAGALGDNYFKVSARSATGAVYAWTYDHGVAPWTQVGPSGQSVGGFAVSSW